jgi:hypothetical protein
VPKRFVMRSLLAVASLGLAASLLMGCGGVSEQGGPSLGGSGLSSAGTGGSGTGGSGTGGSGMAGSSGGAGMGASGAANLPDASMSSNGGTGGGGFTYPEGCPVPSPIAAKPEQKVVIQSFNFNTSEIVLKNVSNTTVVMKNTPPRTGWTWCSFPAYWDIADVDITLAPGQTFKFLPYYNTVGVRAFLREEGELAIYTVSGSFDESTLIENFVSWGTGLRGGREYVATNADVWTYDEHIDVGNSAGFVATGNVKRASGFTPVPARCLVAPENQ